jgi:hypothetical protein
LQLVSRYVRNLKAWSTPKLEPIAPEFLMRRGKCWRTPKLEPIFAPELVRYDDQVQSTWTVQEVVFSAMVHLTSKGEPARINRKIGGPDKMCLPAYIDAVDQYLAGKITEGEMKSRMTTPVRIVESPPLQPSEIHAEQSACVNIVTNV